MRLAKTTRKTLRFLALAGSVVCLASAAGLAAPKARSVRSVLAGEDDKKQVVEVLVVSTVEREHQVFLTLLDRDGSAWRLPVESVGSRKSLVRTLSKVEGRKVRMLVTRKAFTWSRRVKARKKVRSLARSATGLDIKELRALSKK